MPSIKQLSRGLEKVSKSGKINWYPGHMYAGMQAMVGKLNTMDCIVEVHDARIPFIGRNKEFREHLGRIKPRLLVLTKTDLADLSRWDEIKGRLEEKGDTNIQLCDLSGSEFSFAKRGYNKLMENIVELINKSDRYNRTTANFFKIMIVGIPNVGKSTLINRLRQQHLGLKGDAAKTGPQAGVTRHVDNMIKICSRPPVYSVDTPGVLPPSSTKNTDNALKLALCATINDKVVKSSMLASYLLKYLNDNYNYSYFEKFGLLSPAMSLDELVEAAIEFEKERYKDKRKVEATEQVSKSFVDCFRKGYFGKIMFE